MATPAANNACIEMMPDKVAAREAVLQLTADQSVVAFEITADRSPRQ